MSLVNSWKCSLCKKVFECKSLLTRHICEHLSYRKYQCCSCTELFYTEEDREAHCKREGHVHAFGVKVVPYCELYVNMLLKDSKYIGVHGVDVVVVQRSQANLACDIAMDKLSDYADKSRQFGALSGLDELPRLVFSFSTFLTSSIFS